MARTIAQDHEDKRDVILRAAARIIASEGYGRASMAMIAIEAGISKANIYHYYSGKDALLFDILSTHLKGLRDRICGLLFSSDDPEAQLRSILHELLLAYVGADAEHEVQLNALAALPETDQAVLREYQRDLVRFVRARVERLMDPALAADTSNVRAVTMSVFAMVNWHYKWDGQADAKARKAYADLVTRLIKKGVAC